MLSFKVAICFFFGVCAWHRTAQNYLILSCEFLEIAAVSRALPLNPSRELTKPSMDVSCVGNVLCM